MRGQDIFVALFIFGFLTLVILAGLRVLIWFVEIVLGVFGG